MGVDVGSSSCSPAVAEDVVLGTGGVEQHLYHGQLVNEKCVPGHDTTREFESRQEGVYV